MIIYLLGLTTVFRYYTLMHPTLSSTVFPDTNLYSERGGLSLKEENVQENFKKDVFKGRKCPF